MQAVARRLDAAAAAIPGGQNFTFTPPGQPQDIESIKDLAILPLALGAFLALLAVSAIGHALFIAVNRRRRELAVLRALGMTRLQTRIVVATQASVLAVIGLVFGVPLGVALGRVIWRAVADFTPLAYHPPLALWALVLIVPATLLTANTLAAGRNGVPRGYAPHRRCAPSEAELAGCELDPVRSCPRGRSRPPARRSPRSRTASCTGRAALGSSLTPAPPWLMGTFRGSLAVSSGSRLASTLAGRAGSCLTGGAGRVLAWRVNGTTGQAPRNADPAERQLPPLGPVSGVVSAS